MNSGAVENWGSVYIYILMIILIYLICLYREWFISDDPIFLARYVSFTRLLCERIFWYFDLFDASNLKHHTTHDAHKTPFRSQFHLTARHWHFTVLQRTSSLVSRLRKADWRLSHKLSTFGHLRQCSSPQWTHGGFEMGMYRKFLQDGPLPSY